MTLIIITALICCTVLGLGGICARTMVRLKGDVNERLKIEACNQLALKPADEVEILKAETKKLEAQAELERRKKYG